MRIPSLKRGKPRALARGGGHGKFIIEASIITNQGKMNMESKQKLLNWAKDEIAKSDHLEVFKNSLYNKFRVPLLIKDKKEGSTYFFYIDDRGIEFHHLFDMYDIREYNKQKSVQSCNYFGVTGRKIGDDVESAAKDFDIPIIKTKEQFKDILKKYRLS